MENFVDKIILEKLLKAELDYKKRSCHDPNTIILSEDLASKLFDELVHGMNLPYYPDNEYTDSEKAGELDNSFILGRFKIWVIFRTDVVNYYSVGYMK